MNNNGGAQMVTDKPMGEDPHPGRKIWLREDGIVQIVVCPGLNILWWTREKVWQASFKVSKGQRRPMLVDSRNLKSMDRAARQEMAAFEEIMSAAILINSAVSRMIGNVFINFSKPVSQPGSLLPKPKPSSG